MFAPLARRRWGRSELSIPVLSFGTMGISGYFGQVTDEDGVDLIYRAMELGVNHFDCSPCYGDSMHKLGLAVSGMPRESFIVSGRVCLHDDEDTPYDHALPPTRDAVILEAESQLARLGLAYFDALFIHDPDDIGRALAPGGALNGLLSLKERGSARSIGFAMRSHADHLRALLTGEMDVLLTYDDYNLLRQGAAMPGGLLAEAAKGLPEINP